MTISSIHDVMERCCAELWKGNSAQGLRHHEVDGLLGDAHK